MLTPGTASIILLCVCVLLLVVVPIMDGLDRFAKFISLRYILVAMSLIMALGCVLDFSHLAESSRNIILTGALILVGIFVMLRSIEKVKLGGKKVEITIEKGDMKASTTIQGEKKLICEKESKNE
jgi:prepilin signal peptidase PulO-like enzyme (type II secretory pathway)